MSAAFKVPATSSAATSATAGRILLGADLAGVYVFAVEGALTARGGNFDLLGMAVLAFVTALGGGIVRDLLLGAAPPNAVRDQRYPIVALLGALTVILFHSWIHHVDPMLLVVLDAGGLALCAVAGAEKGLLTGVSALWCMILGAVTGCAGGTIRDLLLSRSPWILHKDVYATAAMAGALALVLAQRQGAKPSVAAFIGGGLCFALRVVAAWQGWNLPRVF